MIIPGVRVIVLSLGLLAFASHTVERAIAASLVVEADTQKIISADAPNHLWYPASLTKMMTVYVALSEIEAGRLSFDDTIKVSKHAASQHPVKFGLRSGEIITVRQAIEAAIVASANDAAVALAEKIGGSEEEFALRMTLVARSIGMTDTIFHNASGLPDGGQVTTARDMAVLATSILSKYPQHYPLFGLRSVTIGKRSRGTVNGILASYAGADGLKTGFTCASGYNLVASAERDGRRLIAVVLGSKNGGQRSREVVRLLDAGFASKASGTTTLQNLRDQLGDADIGDPPTILSNATCGGEELVGASVLTSASELSGWGVLLGSQADRAKAERLLRDGQRKLGNIAGRPALIQTSTGSLQRHNAMLVGLNQEMARQGCKALWDQKNYCLALSPSLLKKRFPSTQ